MLIEILDYIFNQDRYPSKVEGFHINYSDPFYEKFPVCGSTTYQTVEDQTVCYCPKCKRLLDHY